MEMRSARAVIVIRVPQVGFEKESEPHLDMQHFFGIYQTAVGCVRIGGAAAVELDSDSSDSSDSDDDCGDTKSTTYSGKVDLANAKNDAEIFKMCGGRRFGMRAGAAMRGKWKRTRDDTTEAVCASAVAVPQTKRARVSSGRKASGADQHGGAGKLSADSAEQASGACDTPQHGSTREAKKAAKKVAKKAAKKAAKAAAEQAAKKASKKVRKAEKAKRSEGKKK